MYLMGIDVGTGGTRALVIDPGGRVVASATEEHAPFASPQTGWAEQDPRDWWRAASVAIREAIAQARVGAEQIACVGLSGQMHGSVLLDDRGEVLRPALLWCDQRTDEQCRTLTAQIGSDRLIELTSNPALTGFTLPKLLWTQQHEPEIWRRVRTVLLPKDYVRFRLTGDRAVDVADASGTLMFNVAERKWSGEMLAAAGVSESQLPRVFESPDVTGVVSGAGAEATGLKTGTKVVAGAGDQAAGATGVGIVRPGAVSATIGTSGVVFAATDRPARDRGGRVHTFCHAMPGAWHVMGVTLAAGLSLRWLRDVFQAADYETLVQEAAAVPPGADGVLWAPYLMGERTPHLDPHARAALVGLAANHTRGYVVRAVLEGVAFSLRDTFSIFDEMRVPVHSVRLGGGGARSALWRQIQADIYGYGVETVEAEEGAAYGAALLAGVGARVWPSVPDACDRVVRIAPRIEPNPQTKHLMDERYRTYRALYPALRGI